MISLFMTLSFVVAIVLVIILLMNRRSSNSYQGNQGFQNLTRSQNNRFIAGVCGGIAEYFGWDATLVRLIFLLFGGSGTLAYIVLAIVVPVSKV